MDIAQSHYVPLWPLLLFAVCAIGLIVLMIGGSAILGERHDEPLGNEPYESGMKPTGSAHMRFSAKFYLVAIIFVLFDLEAVFLFSWAITATDLAWQGYFAFLFFLGVLTVGLVYEWRIGALNWAPATPRQYRLEAIRSNQARNQEKSG